MKGDRRALLRSIGVIRSTLKKRRDAPKQGAEGAPDAWLEVSPFAIEGLHRLSAGSDVIILTWLNQARRDVLKVYPRSDRRNPLTGVFATRSPDRPNPIGLHRVTIRRIGRNRLRIGPIEALDAGRRHQARAVRQQGFLVIAKNDGRLQAEGSDCRQ